MISKRNRKQTLVDAIFDEIKSLMRWFLGFCIGEPLGLYDGIYMRNTVFVLSNLFKESSSAPDKIEKMIKSESAIQKSLIFFCMFYNLISERTI